jgi:hypothetical protein
MDDILHKKLKELNRIQFLYSKTSYFSDENIEESLGKAVFLLIFTASAFLFARVIQSFASLHPCKHRSLSQSFRILSLAVH